jgi:arylsulfatase A-like enzyme
MPLEPPARHAELFAGVSVSLPESYDDPADSLPAMIRDRFEERLAQKDTEPARDRLRDRIRKYWRMVPSIDESVGRVREALLQARALDRTAIFFTSDNGILLGEHGLTLKGRGFDPALRVPLIVRYPPLAQPGTHLEASVLNIDLAPTILELAGLPIPDTVQGRSLVPLLDGSAAALRSSWLYVHPYKDSPNSVGACTDEWKYLLHRRGVPEEQLIDLVHDPGERTNLAGDPEYAERLAELRDGLRQLLELSGAPAEWADPAP